MDPITRSLIDRWCDAYIAVHRIRGLTTAEQDHLMHGHFQLYDEMAARFDDRETMFTVVSAMLARRFVEKGLRHE